MMNWKYAILATLAAMLIGSAGAQAGADSRQLVVPTASQVAWSDAEVGVIIHYDINVFAPQTFDYADAATLPGLEIFNPSRLDTDQWVEAAMDAGAKYAVLVVKHGTGFTLWPSKADDYGVGGTPWKGGKGDVVADFIASCKKYNIRPGFYYNTNANTKYGSGYKPFANKADQAAYNQIVLAQLTELWTGYGELFEIWFDGGVMTEKEGGIAGKVSRLLARHQPQAVLFQGPAESKNLIRWIGNEEGHAPYPHWSTIDSTTASNGLIEIKDLRGNPEGRIWCPGESDVPNRKASQSWNGGWLWRAGEEHALYSPAELVERYYMSVGRNSNMLMGMVIDTAGMVPEADRRVFKEFGDEIKRRFSQPVATASGRGTELEIVFDSPRQVNHIVIQEDITGGERIRNYTVEALVEGHWVVVAHGQSVSHKKIDRFDSVMTEKIRLTVTRAVATPIIRNFAAYNVS